eukprot:353124-Chlamydomonas_euryale.AAC.3
MQRCGADASGVPTLCKGVGRTLQEFPRYAKVWGGRFRSSQVMQKCGADASAIFPGCATGRAGALPSGLVPRIVARMCADNLVLLADSNSLDDLAVLLGMVDVVASENGLFMYAAKTQIMVVRRPLTLPTFQLSGKELHWSLIVLNTWGPSLWMMGR